jgi:hypothetical protein
MARHILIATATSKYEHLSHQDNRPQLSRVLASIEDLFTRKLKCYERVLDDIAENPPSGILRTLLDQWFASTERDPADWVVILLHRPRRRCGNRRTLPADHRFHAEPSREYGLQFATVCRSCSRKPSRRNSSTSTEYVVDRRYMLCR